MRLEELKEAKKVIGMRYATKVYGSLDIDNARTDIKPNRSASRRHQDCHSSVTFGDDKNVLKIYFDIS